jgi:hypothetical protein
MLQMPEHSFKCSLHLFQCFHSAETPCLHRNLICSCCLFHPHCSKCYVFPADLRVEWRSKVALTRQPNGGAPPSRGNVRWGERELTITLGNANFLEHKILFSTTYKICFSSLFIFLCFETTERGVRIRKLFICWKADFFLFFFRSFPFFFSTLSVKLN